MYYVYGGAMGVLLLAIIISLFFMIFEILYTSSYEVGEVLKKVRGKKEKVSIFTDNITSFEPMIVKLKSINT